MSELTKQEKAALTDWWDSEWPHGEGDVIDTLQAVVARIKADAEAAARAEVLAKVEALADEWSRSSREILAATGDFNDSIPYSDHAARLRALVADLGGEPS